MDNNVNKNMAIISNTGEVLNIIVCQDDKPETSNLITYTEANPAYIGGTFDNGYFYSPKPYPSWTRSNGKWISPVERPILTEEQVLEHKYYTWNEEILNWELMNGKT